MIKCRSKLINREEILNFTPINHLLRPDYLGVGTTGVESEEDCIHQLLIISP